MISIAMPILIDCRGCKGSALVSFVNFWIGQLYCIALQPVFSDKKTSSTAQGGGGSFEIGKSIAEAGGHESRMAERIH